jgi:small nuclear ribonucleoprotein (snRNP)-like protein
VKREFGPYTLLRRHAIGGMSVVFIAQDNTLGREVVVKHTDGLKSKGKLAAYDGTSITLERTERVPKPVGKGKMDQTIQTQIPLAELSSITLDFKF